MPNTTAKQSGTNRPKDVAAPCCEPAGKDSLTESNYSILPDELFPKKFRVAWAGSEYTVSFKKELQHGLTKAKAQKVKAMLDARRESAINRLMDLLDEWDEINPQGSQEEEVKRMLECKYRIGVKTIHNALLMRAQGEF